jgi:hypothetical protein
MERSCLPRGQEVRERGRDQGSTFPFEDIPFITQRPPISSHVSKVPPPLQRVKLGAKPLPQGLWGNVTDLNYSRWWRWGEGASFSQLTPALRLAIWTQSPNFQLCSLSCVTLNHLKLPFLWIRHS